MVLKSINHIKKKNKNRKKNYMLIMILFKLFLDISYKYVISTQYNYMGFLDNQNVWFQILSWIIFMIFTVYSYFFYRNKGQKIANEMILVLYMFAFVPFTTLVAFGMFSINYIIFNVIYWFLLFLFVIKISSKSNVHYRVEKRSNSPNFAIYLFTIISVFIVMYTSWKYTNFRLYFNIFSVYDIRLEARDYGMSTLLTYAYSFTKMTNAILITYFMLKKKKILAILIFVVQLFSFGIDGSKTTLFLAIVALGIGLLPKINYKTINLLFVSFICMVTIFSLVIYLTTDYIMPLSLFSRRVLVDPQRISFQYFDYFSTHTPDFYSQSFLRYFGLESKYEKPIAFVIAEYYEKESFSANNGLISEAIANLGYFGILVLPFVMALLLKVFNYVSINVDFRIKVIISVYFSVVLTNSFLSTALMTHGLLITMVLLFILSRSKKIIYLKKRKITERVVICNERA